MTIDWNEYEGAPIRTWRLDRFLGERAGKAYFMTHDEQSRPTLIHVIPADSEGSAAVLESWTRARDLDCDYLLRPRECGQDALNLTAVNYAVTALPDDDLSELLAKRLLGHTEAVEVFSAVAKALNFLHERGLSHGEVIPSSIFYVDGGIKLAVDRLALAELPDLQADLRQFGVTLSHSLAKMDSPFDEIAAACTDPVASEWTAARVMARLAQPASPKRASSLRRFGMPAAAIAAAVSIFIVIRKHSEVAIDPVPRTVREASARPAASIPSAATPSVPPHTPVAAKPTPFSPNPSPLGGAERSTRTATRPAPKERSWAVIAAAYHDYKSAEKRAESMKRQWPLWKTHVSPKEGRGQRYFVVIGSGLNKDAADQLRNSAVNKGAPKDTYVTKLDES